MPQIYLYVRPGCYLCDESRAVIEALLAERQAHGLAPLTIVERDISTDPTWEQLHFAEIPVVEVGDRRLALAISPRAVRRFFDDVLGPVPAA